MQFRRWIVIILLAGITVLSATGYTDRALNRLGIEQLTRINTAYLFDCILFPLLFGLILITMIKGGVHYFFDLSRLRGP